MDPIFFVLLAGLAYPFIFPQPAFMSFTSPYAMFFFKLLVILAYFC